MASTLFLNKLWFNNRRISGINVSNCTVKIICRIDQITYITFILVAWRNEVTRIQVTC